MLKLRFIEIFLLEDDAHEPERAEVVDSFELRPKWVLRRGLSFVPVRCSKMFNKILEDFF
jgi:hypothetical protein